MEIPKNRIFYLDILRAFAIFFVLSCHCFDTYVVNIDIFGTAFWYYSLFLNSLRDLGVPLFVLLSGSLLLNKKENLITFVKKRVSRVIIPCLFWVFLFILCSLIFEHYGFNLYPFTDLNNLIYGVFHLKNTASYFWFVPMIFSVYVVIFLINKLNEYYLHTLKISLTLSILLIVLYNFNIIQFAKPYYKYIFYSVFAIIGYYLANFDFKNKFTSKSLYIIFATIFIVSYLIEVYINASMSLSLNQFNCVSQFSFINLVSLISIFLFIRYLSEEYEFNGNKNHISKIIFSISVCSYGIYLSHIIVKCFLINVILIHIKNYIPISVYSTIILLTTLICSWILILILNKIPYIKKISGAN